MRASVAAALGICLHLVPPAQAIGVRDDSGRQVVLDQAARRIVTLAPHATELAVAAGAAARLVGIASGPPVAGAPAGLPRIGGPGALDREALLQLRPDLVIGWQSGNRTADLDWIERSGIPLFRSEPRTLGDVAAAIRAIGALSDSAQAATAAAAVFTRATRTACAALPPRPAYVLAWERPPLTFGGRHWINDALRAAGYRNHFAAVDAGVFPVAPEALLAAAAATRVSLAPAADGGTHPLAAMLSRPGPQLAEAVQLLCRQRLRADTAYAPARPLGVR